jgi:hypothetical protein
MHVAMKRHDEMCDAHGLDHREEYRAEHMVSRVVLAMGLVRTDVEVGEVSIAFRRAERFGQTQSRPELGPLGRCG